MKKALVTGITGQDGSYLAELLLSKGYEVHGLIRRSSSINTQRLDNIYRDPHESGVRFLMHYGDLSDSGSLINLIRDLEPHEIYHLGAQSHVRVSFDIPEYTADTTAWAPSVSLKPFARQASTRASIRRRPRRCSAPPRLHRRRRRRSTREAPTESRRCSPIGRTVNYREAHGMFASNGILFNHESATTRRDLRHSQDHSGRRPHQGRAPGRLYLGNLDAKRDWGYAPEIRRGDVADAAAG